MARARHTLEAEKRLEASGIAIRQLARRLKTSPSQVYRLLETTNYKKSISQMLVLLHALDCEVDLVVSDRKATLRSSSVDKGQGKDHG